jgi:hypothetical protein
VKIEIDGDGHPSLRPKRESPGATAQRRQASQGLGNLGSPTGEVAGPRRTAPKQSERVSSGAPPVTGRVTIERRERERSGRLHEGGPKQGHDLASAVGSTERGA